MLAVAKNDPHGFVKHSNGLLFIDEVQRIPSLLLAVKKEVDEDTRSGQFLLTGSADIRSLPGAVESLAGRVKKVRLRPLSQAGLPH